MFELTVSVSEKGALETAMRQLEVPERSGPGNWAAGVDPAQVSAVLRAAVPHLTFRCIDCRCCQSTDASLMTKLRLQKFVVRAGTS